MENESKIMSMYHSINSYGVKQINPSSESEYYSPLYGELTYRGTQSIIKSFSSYFNKNTVFYDFGSGLGKMVIHLGNLIPPIKKSIGIEYSLGRYEGAVNLAKDSRLDNDKIKFINGNFFTTDVSDATVIYIDNHAMFKEEWGNKLWSVAPTGCLLILATDFLGNGIIKKYTNCKENIGIQRTYPCKDRIFYAIKE